MPFSTLLTLLSIAANAQPGHSFRWQPYPDFEKGIHYEVQEINAPQLFALALPYVAKIHEYRESAREAERKLSEDTQYRRRKRERLAYLEDLVARHGLDIEDDER